MQKKFFIFLLFSSLFTLNIYSSYQAAGPTFFRDPMTGELWEGEDSDPWPEPNRNDPKFRETVDEIDFKTGEFRRTGNNLNQYGKPKPKAPEIEILSDSEEVSETIKPTEKPQTIKRRLKRFFSHNPKLTAGIVLGAGFCMMGQQYMHNKKFRKKVDDAAEHYYYRLLEKLMPITFKWSDLEEQPLTQKDVICAIGLVGMYKGLKTINSYYGVSDSFFQSIPKAKKHVLYCFDQASLFMKTHRDWCKLGLGVIVTGSIARYIYHRVTSSQVKYKFLLDTFMASLTQEQIASIGTRLIFDISTDPLLLQKEDVIKHLDTAQKEKASAIIAAYKKYIALFKQA